MLNPKSPSLLNKWTCHRLVFTERKENMGFVEFNFLIFESSRKATPFMMILNRLRVCLQFVCIRHEHLLYRSKAALIENTVNQNNPFTVLGYKQATYGVNKLHICWGIFYPNIDCWDGGSNRRMSRYSSHSLTDFRYNI